jgi:hypothetical protein
MSSTLATSPSNIPIPDPSLVTVAALMQLRIDLKADFEDKLKAQFALLDEKIAGVKAVSGDRYQAVQGMFTTQQKLFDAVDAANSEAARKAETNTEKRISDLGALFTSEKKGADAALNLANERLTRLESSLAGVQLGKSERRLDIGTVMGAISLAIVAIGAIAGVIAFVGHSAPATALPQITYAPIGAAPPAK